MVVIGYNGTPEYRGRMWNDLLESKASVRRFLRSQEEQERSIGRIDQDFYSRTLQKYVA